MLTPSGDAQFDLPGTEIVQKLPSLEIEVD